MLHARIIKSGSTEGLFRVTKSIPKTSGYIKFSEEELKGTVLDHQLNESGGFIKLPVSTPIFIHEEVQQHLPNIPATASPSWVKTLLPKQHADIVFTPKAGNYIYLPAGISKMYQLDSGMMVLSSIQRAANHLIYMINLIGYVDLKKNRRVAGAYNAAVNSYLAAVKREIFYKGGILDSMMGSVLPYSGRAVLINNPDLNLNEVSIPRALLSRWMKYSEFRDALGLEDKDIYSLEGMRILIGRQPTHRYTNLFSCRIRVAGKGVNAVGMNPLVVNLFDGDFDGDTVHIWMPTNPGVRAEMSNILAVENMLPQSSPSKEFKGVQLDSDIQIANSTASKIREKFNFSGHSITWKDLVDTDGGTGYYASVDQSQFETMRQWARGEYPDSFKHDVDACMDYRIIKGGVARAGGLSNSIVTMCLTEAWKQHETDIEGAVAKMKLVGDFKHALCQDMLDAKHGDTDEDQLAFISRMFYGPRFEYQTRKEYKSVLMDMINIPDKETRRKAVEHVVDTYFNNCEAGVPENINNVVARMNPHYVLTRKQAKIAHLQQFKPITNMHSYFMFRENKESTNV